MTNQDTLNYLQSQLQLILQEAQKGEAELEKLNQRTDASLISKVAERRFRKTGYMAQAGLIAAMKEGD